MTDEQFAVALHHQVVVDNLIQYRQFLDAPSAEIKDSRLKSLVECYKTMEPATQEALIYFLSLISVNAVSEVLGILDGTTQVAGKMQDFVLMHEQQEVKVNGYLQDYFLEIVEEQNIFDD